jgi:hypothetical protein
MDNWITLSNRLLNRAPLVGIVLAQQFVNDAWATLQAKREWSFRRRSGIFSPPNVYQFGMASTNVGIGAPTLITGLNTTWTPDMIGRQIRVGGINFPFYTIANYLSPTALLIDQPWGGVELTNQPYQILQSLYPVPADFGYWLWVVSIKDAFQLWTNVTQDELAWMDPQRVNFGQTYSVCFRDYTPQYGGTIGKVIPCVVSGASPISTTSVGYNYVADATYIIQVVQPGTSGLATFKWRRHDFPSFSPEIITSDMPMDMADGVQVYWPDAANYMTGDVFIINCISLITQSTPRYELWPAPTYANYLYPYMYIAKEYELTTSKPQLPPFIANRGEVLLEMALEKCAEYPGSDADHPNPYHDLKQAQWHREKARDMVIDLERNDEEVGVTNITYQNFPMYPSPWMTGQWQQTHAPFYNG